MIASKPRFAFLGLLACFALLVGCAPEVGSPKWCDAIKAKPKGEITANEAGDFAKHCLFK